MQRRHHENMPGGSKQRAAPRSQRKQRAAAEPHPSAGECLLLLLPEDLLVAVLDKLGCGPEEDTRPARDAKAAAAAAVAFAEASGRPVTLTHCLLAHAKAVARAERSCKAVWRSCGGLWRRMLQQHKLGYEGVELVEPTGASWKQLLEAAMAQPVRLDCSAAVDAGVLPLRCRGLAAQFRGRLGSDQADIPTPDLPRP